MVIQTALDALPIIKNGLPMVLLANIIEALGGQLHGDPQTPIHSIASLEEAESGAISFLSNPKYAAQLAHTHASCVIVAPAAAESLDAEHNLANYIVTPNPYLYFAKLTQWWRQQKPVRGTPGIHPSAVVDPTAKIDPTASIGPLCVVEARAEIGANTILTSRITVGYDCKIGERCIIHPGVSIGADGFGFAPDNGAWVKIEQLGAVRIGNDVEIGANTCVDRGALKDTVLEDGVKLDNLIMIAHNVHVGKNTAMAAFVGISGSTTIGENCTFSGGAGVSGHLQLTDGVHVGAHTVISRSIPKKGQYTGLYPFEEHRDWERNAASLRQLNTLRTRIKSLEKELAALAAKMP